VWPHLVENVDDRELVEQVRLAESDLALEMSYALEVFRRCSPHHAKDLVSAL